MAQKDISSVVSGLGLGCGFITALDKERRKFGVSDADFRAAIAEESPLIPKFGSMIAESCKPKLLESVATITVPATTEKFVAKDRFVVDTSDEVNVRISYLGDNFKALFLGKTEEPFAGSTLQSFRLKQSSLDGPIITELGGEAKAETTLAEIYALMERQKNGESGILLTNGYANVFYVRDAAGVLRAVGVHWYGDGWDVYADSTSGPGEWRGGGQVLSRNS